MGDHWIYLATSPPARTVHGVKAVVTHGLGSSSLAMRTLLAPVLPDAVYVQAPTRAGVPRTGAWVDAVVNVSGAGPVVLVGHSWGGSVMAQAAALLPGAYAVLLCPAPRVPGTRAVAGKVSGRVVVVAGSHDALLRTGPAAFAQLLDAPLLVLPGVTHSGFLRPAPRMSMRLEVAVSRSSSSRLAQRHLVRDTVAALFAGVATASAASSFNV